MSGDDTRAETTGAKARSGGPPPDALPASEVEGTRLAVEHEHSQLDEQLRQCRESLAGGRVRPGSLELALELSEAVEAHFGREESLYYPTLAALRPELADPLERIVEAHADFRARLAAIVADVRSGAAEQAEQALAELAARFQVHEQVEESLLERVAQAAVAPS